MLAAGTKCRRDRFSLNLALRGILFIRGIGFPARLGVPQLNLRPRHHIGFVPTRAGPELEAWSLMAGALSRQY